VAFEYNDGHRLRAKIHEVSSVATLPLLGADAGSLATAALGPESEHGNVEGSRGRVAL
jgi:hypothetical protein